MKGFLRNLVQIKTKEIKKTELKTRIKNEKLDNCLFLLTHLFVFVVLCLLCSLFTEKVLISIYFFRIQKKLPPNTSRLARISST